MILHTFTNILVKIFFGNNLVLTDFHMFPLLLIHKYITIFVCVILILNLQFFNFESHNVEFVHKGGANPDLFFLNADEKVIEVCIMKVCSCLCDWNDSFTDHGTIKVNCLSDRNMFYRTMVL